MKKMFILVLLASALLLLPGCLSKSIKTADDCNALEGAQPAGSINWAGSDTSQYQDAWAYEKMSCWHEAAIWYAIKGNVLNATDCCQRVYNVDWPVEDFRDDERNLCISDIAEKLGEQSLCDNIPDTVDNAYLRERCITQAQKASDLDNRQICSGTIFILAGLGAFLFANSKMRK